MKKMQPTADPQLEEFDRRSKELQQQLDSALAAAGMTMYYKVGEPELQGNSTAKLVNNVCFLLKQVILQNETMIEILRKGSERVDNT